MGWEGVGGFFKSVNSLKNEICGYCHPTSNSAFRKFFQKISTSKKSTLLYGKLPLQPLHCAYADPTNRRRISDTLTCAERADNLAILLLLALSRLDAAELATHLYTFYLCQLSAAIQSVTNVITLYLGKATQYGRNHLGNGIWLSIGVEGA